PDDVQRLDHLLHPDEIPGVAVAAGRAYYLERALEVGVSETRLVLSQVASDAAGPGDRAGATRANSIRLRQYADALGAVHEDAVAVQEPGDVGVRLREVADELADEFDGLGRDVVHQPADPTVARVEPLPRGALEDVVDRLPHVERVQERGERPEVEGGG